MTTTDDRAELLANRIQAAPKSWLPDPDSGGEEVVNITFTVLERDLIVSAIRARAADAGVREALRLAISHIEHMAAFISKANTDYRCGTYSLESIGEDMPGMKSALAQSPADTTEGE